MEHQFRPEMHDFSVVKERIMKTSQIIEMYKKKEAVLAKATKAFKNLKALYEKSCTNLKRLEQENSLITYRNTVLTSKVDEYYTDYSKMLADLEVIKPEHEKLLEKYNEKLIECQNLEINYNQLLLQCTCHQEFDINQFKYRGMKMYRELKQQYNQLKLKTNVCKCQVVDSKKEEEIECKEEAIECREEAIECSEDEEVPRILEEAKMINEIDLVTRFSESPTLEDSPPCIVVTPPTPSAESDRNFILEALKQKQIDRRRKYWIPNNFCNFPARKASIKSKKSLSQFNNLLNQLVKAKIGKLMTKRRRKRLGEFTSETESELERLFDKKNEILGRNRRLVALAKIQNPNLSDSDVMDSGLVTASPKNSTDVSLCEDLWFVSSPKINQDCRPQLKHLESKILNACEAQTSNLEEPQTSNPLDLGVCEGKSKILEDSSCKAPLDPSNLDLRACEAQTNNLEEPQGEEPLNLGMCEVKSKILEDPSVKAPLDPPNLDFRACEAETNNLEEPETEEVLNSEACEGKSKILEDPSCKAPLDPSNLDLRACEAQTNNLEEPEPLNPEACEGRSKILEDPSCKAPSDPSNLYLRACEAQTNNLEEPEREELLNSEACEGKSTILEDPSCKAPLDPSNLDLRACEAQTNNLEEPQRHSKACEDKSKILEDQVKLKPPNLHLRARKAQSQNVKLLREENSDTSEAKSNISQHSIIKATLELQNLDLGACETQTNSLENQQREQSLNSEESTNLEDPNIEAKLHLRACEAQARNLEEKLLNSEACDVKLDSKFCKTNSQSSINSPQSPKSQSDSLISILKSLEAMKCPPMLSPLPPSPQPIVATTSTVKQKISFDDVDLEADLYLSEEEERAPKRKAPTPQISAKIKKLTHNKGSFGLEEPKSASTPRKPLHKRRRDVLSDILDGMKTLKPPEVKLIIPPTFTEEDCPKSPSIIEVPYELPKLIPLNENRKLTGEEARALMDQLICASSEQALNDIVIRLSGQKIGFVAWIILDKVRTDIGKLQKPSNPICPVLTRLQQILLGFLCKLEKTHHPGVMDKFLDLADKMVRKRYNNNVTRLVMGLCKVRQDLPRARRFVFTCFYYGRNFAPLSVLFVVLKTYPQVLPCQTTDDPLAKTFVQICFSRLCKLSCAKFMQLRVLLETRYNYIEESLESVFNDLYRRYIENPTKKQIQYSLVLLLMHQDKDWIIDKLENRLWPLYSVIPSSNSNLKATLVLFIGKICTHFQSEEIRCKVRQWFEDLMLVESSDLVKRSVVYVYKKYPKIGLTKID